jgi:hypothetical protein
MLYSYLSSLIVGLLECTESWSVGDLGEWSSVGKGDRRSVISKLDNDDLNMFCKALFMSVLVDDGAVRHRIIEESHCMLNTYTRAFS